MAERDTLNENDRGAGQLISRFLSPNIPKPNIVRIERLDGSARQRYLGTLHRIGDSVRSTIFETVNKDKSGKVFYGFLKPAGNQTFGWGNTWSGPQEGSGNLMGSMKTLSQKTLGPTATSGIEGLANISRRLTGINASTTGSTSLKNYGGVQLNDFDVDCGWYLPEQLNLCINSLVILSRMGFPLQLPDGILDRDGISALIDEFIQRAQDEDSITQEEREKTIGILNTVKNKAISASKFVAGVGMESINTFNELFGRNFTFDPLPVRVSIGQYIDVEPLVISGIKIIFSKETFVVADETDSFVGRHLPITCSVNISFKYWLTPAPKLEFASLLGRELFGEKPALTKEFNEAKLKQR